MFSSRRECRAPALNHPPSVSTSTLRATKKQCHSAVRPVPTWTCQSVRFCPLFRVLAPSAVGEGSKDSPKQEDRKMKVEQAKQIASNAIEQLRQALEAGHSARLKECLAAMARFRRYSWGNVMLIASQKPHARRRLSRLAQARPVREEGRESNSDSRSDHPERDR